MRQRSQQKRLSMITVKIMVTTKITNTNVTLTER